ncbi:MAG: DUF1732 domain-containing protein [Candidatus Stygibacter frigidus]|nr:DUF1732 domain-containing protein [Candidatus Stygibacter frigidus]
MRSMTGYGKSVYSGEDYLIEFEIKSVNSRFLDIRMNLPRELSFMEMEINNIIKDKINRGKISGRINLISFKPPELKINETKLKAYNDVFVKIKQITDNNDDIPLQLFLENEEIVYQSDDFSKDNDLKSRIISIVESGIKNHQDTALKEGKSMHDYMMQAVKGMRESLSKIEIAFPTYRNEVNEQIQSHAKELYGKQLGEEELKRLALEIAIYVEKSDVTEEIVRLHHHLNKFQETIDNENDIGKNLNFILQEMHRETNTLGSKYNHNAIFEEMINIKEEIEKCREIVQNIV